MTYKVFMVPEEKSLELFGKLVEFYGMRKTSGKSEDETEIVLTYPTGVMGDIELHAYISKTKTPSKVMIIGEMPAIDHARLNLETLIRGKLQATQ